MFALLALEALGSVSDEAVAIVAVTVLLSVLTHGLTAAPLARRFGSAEDAAGPEPGGPVTVIPIRRGTASRLDGSYATGVNAPSESARTARWS